MQTYRGRWGNGAIAGNGAHPIFEKTVYRSATADCPLQWRSETKLTAGMSSPIFLLYFVWLSWIFCANIFSKFCHSLSSEIYYGVVIWKALERKNSETHCARYVYQADFAAMCATCSVTRETVTNHKWGNGARVGPIPPPMGVITLWVKITNFLPPCPPHLLRFAWKLVTWVIFGCRMRIWSLKH